MDGHAARPIHARTDAVLLKADRTYTRCGSEYERDARRGADRAFKFSEDYRKAVFDDASHRAVALLKADVPEKCWPAVTAFERSFRDFESARKLFSAEVTLARPGNGEWDQAAMATVSARSNYLCLKALLSQIKAGSFPLCVD